jgi:hypothetical protein
LPLVQLSVEDADFIAGTVRRISTFVQAGMDTRTDTFSIDNTTRTLPIYPMETRFIWGATMEVIRWPPLS